MIKCLQNITGKGLQRMTMQYSGLNNNKERREFWDNLDRLHPAGEIKEAFNAVDPISAKVLQWHYREGKTFAEITGLLGRSISIVRNHHNRGIFQLQQYFINNSKSNERSQQ